MCVKMLNATECHNSAIIRSFVVVVADADAVKELTFFAAALGKTRAR